LKAQSKKKSKIVRSNLVGTQKDELVRFIGISLGGGKSDSAAFAVLDYYPLPKKLFLIKLYDQIASEPQVSADLKIIELMERYRYPSTSSREAFQGSTQESSRKKQCVQSIAFDVPFELPLCVSCRLPCPSYENCKEPHIRWMWTQTHKKQNEKKNKKLFTPYTQKSVELFLEQELEEVFHRNDALGSNLGPLTMRAHFLAKRIPCPKIEVYPKLSLWRMGKDLKILKRHLKNHRASLGGEESRTSILNEITEQKLAFLYQQDQKLMLESVHAFDAFISAFTGFLKFQGLTEPRPSGFPKSETWIEFPKNKLDLVKLLG